MHDFRLLEVGSLRAQSVHEGCRGSKVVKRCSLGALPIHLFRHFCCSMYHLATMYSVTDRQIIGQTDDIIISLYYACSMIG